MKKSKKKIIWFVFFLILFFLILIIKGKSNARYVTQEEGKGVLQVAKWAFSVNGEKASITNLNLAESYHADTLVENRIAPGTKGSFAIVIDTTDSEVEINYEVTFRNEKHKPQNLKFIYDNHTVSTVKELEPFLKGTIKADAKEKIKTITVVWQWPYETGNSAKEKEIQNTKDTQDGKTLEQYQFDILITGKQVEPVA